jgi:hypothetical protein
MNYQVEQTSREFENLDRPFYLFIHVPKTAGTTLRSIVDFQHGVQNTITYYNQNSRQLLDNLDAMLTVRKHDYQTLIGHFQYGVHEGLSCDFQYVTFLRDPVARAISSYYEGRKTQTSRLTKADGTLMTLAESMVAYRNSYDNQQTRYLVGKSGRETLSMADVDAAIDALERDFLYAGLVEKFDQSILLLSKRIGWKPCSYRPLNQGSQHEIQQSDIETLVGLNHYDQLVYDHVQEKNAADSKIDGTLFQAAFEEWMAARRLLEAGEQSVPVKEIEIEYLPRVQEYLLN